MGKGIGVPSPGGGTQGPELGGRASHCVGRQGGEVSPGLVSQTVVIAWSSLFLVVPLLEN